MNNNETGFFSTLLHLEYKTILATVLAIIITTLTLSTGCIAFYRNVKNSISLQGQLNAKQSAEEFKNYMISSTNSIKLAAYTLNEMIENKSSVQDMLKFLTSESNDILNSYDENFTGLYGWICGQYLDGGGWVPDSDYVPTERPWYTVTLAHESQIVYIKPYVDMQTGTMMMTISILLNDKKSVVALDVSLTRLQKIIETVSQNKNENHIMILDYDGDVVVHAGSGIEADNLDFIIAQKVLKEQLNQFELKYKGKKYVIYAEEVNGGWYSISAINANHVYRPLHHIFASSIFAILMTSFIILIVFVSITRKNIITNNLNVRLNTIADIYEAMFDINIKKNYFTSIRSTKKIDAVIGVGEGKADEILYYAINQLVDEISKPIMNKFIDFSTLEERFNGSNTITEEFLNVYGFWCRGRFIVAGKDSDNSISRVLFVVESIDKEKRHRDVLKHLSETDSLTDINNRGSGEYKISNLLAKNECGMFILLDVDDFKSINDVYGHNTGDKVLVAIAHSLKNAFRGGDIVMRLGGDEFVAFAVGVHTSEEGKHAIKRLFKNIDAIKIEELNERKICVSVGAYCYDGKEICNFKDLYKLADQCTYTSKKKTGNAVTFYKE